MCKEDQRRKMVRKAGLRQKRKATGVSTRKKPKDNRCGQGRMPNWIRQHDCPARTVLIPINQTTEQT